jgi:hypothetical protein
MRQIGILLAVGILLGGGASFRNATSQEKPVYKSTGSEGTIVGTISFTGTPPEPWRIDSSADPVCGTLSPDLTTDWVLVHDRKLANVFVYLQRKFEPLFVRSVVANRST